MIPYKYKEIIDDISVLERDLGFKFKFHVNTQYKIETRDVVSKEQILDYLEYLEQQTINAKFCLKEMFDK